jgi:hypothetical protein
MFTLSLRSRCEAALGTASIGALQHPDLTAAGGRFKPSAAARRAREPVASVNLI